MPGRVRPILNQGMCETVSALWTQVRSIGTRLRSLPMLCLGATRGQRGVLSALRLMRIEQGDLRSQP